MNVGLGGFSAKLICSALAISMLLPAGVAKADECVPLGKVLLPANNKVISHVALTQTMADKKVVLLGEHHDNAEHHRWQLQMLAGLHVANENLAIGFEMFPRRIQSVLDQWVAGELSEEEFLKAVEWEKYWRFDADLYMPLFHYARMNHIPMYALNVERGLIREVGEKGWEGVEVENREGITRPAPPSEGYQLMLAGVFSQHGSKHAAADNEAEVDEAALKEIMATPMFQRFVESQQVWDRAMAEAIAHVVKEKHPDMFIAVMGSGHMMNFYGVPHQLADLGVEQPAVLVPWDPEFDCSYVSAGFADAVVSLKPEKLSQLHLAEQKPRLGVYLEPAEKGVKIIRVVENSLAAQSGIKKGDIVVAMAGKPINEVQQVIDTVKSMQWGTWLPVTVLRGADELEIIAKFPAAGE